MRIYPGCCVVCAMLIPVLFSQGCVSAHQRQAKAGYTIAPYDFAAAGHQGGSAAPAYASTNTSGGGAADPSLRAAQDTSFPSALQQGSNEDNTLPPVFEDGTAHIPGRNQDGTPAPELISNHRPVNLNPASSARLRLFGEVNGAGGTQHESSAVENITQVSFAMEGADSEPDVDSTGKLVVYSSTQHNRAADIYVKGIDGQTVTQLTSDPAQDVMPKFSADNSRIAFCSNRAGNYDIYIMSATGGSAIQVTNDPAQEIHPSWSPDGRHIVYSRLSEQSGAWELWVTDVDNLSVRRFIGYGLCPEWNPDARTNLIAFQKARERGSRLFGIWTVKYQNDEGIEPTEIASAVNAAVINPSWSPDGTMLTFTTVVDPADALNGPTDQPKWADVWIVNVDGSNKANLTNGQYANLEPTWSPDGRVLFVSNRAGIQNIWAIGPERTIEAARGPQTMPEGSKQPAVAGVDTESTGRTSGSSVVNGPLP